jgi:hypothetical protein
MPNNPLIDYIHKQQHAIVEASKQTLHNKYYFSLSIQGDSLHIKSSLVSAHKQFFALMLKQNKSPRDLQLVSGFCGIIWLINIIRDTPLINDDYLSTIDHLCKQLPKLLQKQIHINAIESIIHIDEHLMFIRRLPVTTEAYSKSKYHLCLNQNDLFFNAYIPCKHHKISMETHNYTLTSNNNQYCVKVSARPDYTHNVYIPT